ncbi:hypothetical protein [Enterobacter bugandensis]|uniref:hypothetical protein n=1 Tax=Enterobacter bugandensis TaxID=881260 RepID=UPI002005A9C3|nr:hypothetical protein [Enterobacter bugandensis]MCK6964549.1 hypothetical protein [Enterobacter bugandensis]
MKKPPEFHIQGIRYKSLTVALQLLASSLPEDSIKIISDKINKYDEEIPYKSNHPLEISLREQLEEIKYLLNLSMPE